MGAHAFSARSGRLPMARSLPEPLRGGWRIDVLAGRFVEITGGPQTSGLTLCSRLIVEAQQAGGMVAWVGGKNSSFYPPDFVGVGIDLKALPVVRLEDPKKLWRVCDTLLRSGSFVLVVVDLDTAIRLSLSAQTRLGALAQHHRVALVALSRPTRGQETCSSLVSIRAETFKQRSGHDCFVCGLRIVKDKRGVPGWTHQDVCRGTDSLC